MARAQRTARSRRTGDEVRARMLTAAREVFADRGYAGATTKQITERAEVGEVLLFRHFGSKARLFEEAVLDPFSMFVDEWVARWARRGSSEDPVAELAREYFDLLYGFLHDNRQLVIAMLKAQAHHPETAARLQTMFDRLADTIREGTSEYHLPTMDPAVTVRLTFGMVLSTVEHAELFFAADVRPSRRELVDQMTRYAMHGIIHEPPAANA
jgi:AcrR family transcriptional regulator